jgi:hypothetical protein
MRCLLLICLFCCSFSAHATDTSSWTTHGTHEIGRLLSEVQPPPRFAEHKPQFSFQPQTVTFHGPKGTYQETLTVIYDHQRAIALRSHRPQLDLFTPDPAQGFTEIPWPARYHNATIWGTRITTIPFLGPSRPTGTIHQHQWEVAADQQSITLHEWQEWDGTGKDIRTAGRIDYRFTLSLDPILGYVIDLDATLDFDGAPQGRQKIIESMEFNNFLDGRMSDVWPERKRYDFTIYTPGKGDMFAGNRFAGWASNTVAGEFSDDGPRQRQVRSHGFMAFVDNNSWSPFLTTQAPTPLSLRTCNVWQDQHNHLPLPKPDKNGRVTMRWQARHAYLPPEVSTAVLAQAVLDDFEQKKAVIIRLGQTESFDDQPLPLTLPIRGATSAYGLRLSTKRARSGNQSLQIKGNPDLPRGRYDARGNFLPLPQIRLEPHTTYKLEAWVWVEGPETIASMTADTYEWTPHTDDRLEAFETNTVHAAPQWQRIALTIHNGASDIFSDLRFRVRGSGSAWFDDVTFQPVPSER